MKRRSLLKGLTASLALGMPDTLSALPKMDGKIELDRAGCFSLDGNKLRFTHPGVRRDFRITVIADTHLFRDDERGRPFRFYSGRMAQAYNRTRHFLTGAETNPEAAFEETVAKAVEGQSEFIALLGDIFSFPSEAAIDWSLDVLRGSGMPFFYTAGNHDWHYEGMDGSSASLRTEWIEKRLKKMYPDADPLMYMTERFGVRFIFIDNSTYEILPEQLAFFQSAMKAEKPALLFMHIPLYAPGRPVSFGCAHPDWGARTDRNHELERRVQWPSKGHSKTTLEFRQAVISNPNLLGVVAGHIHNPSVDIVNGMPQVVTEANAEGGWLDISFQS